MTAGAGSFRQVLRMQKNDQKPDIQTLKGQPVVYMLRCRDDSLYTGWTNDFMQRLAAHSSGHGGKYTRSRLPLRPVYLELVADRSAALQREAAIKKLSPAEKRRLVSSSLNVLGEYLTSRRR